MSRESLQPVMDVFLGVKAALVASMAALGGGVAIAAEWLKNPDSMLVFIGGAVPVALAANQLFKTILEARKDKRDNIEHKQRLKLIDAQEKLARELTITEAEKHGSRRKTDKNL